MNFIPIDVPKLQLQELTEFTEEWAYWKFIRLTKPTKSYQKSEWICPNKLQYIKRFIEEYLPFTDMVNVKINIQTKEVYEHIDFTQPEINEELYNHNKSLEPCGYRILLQGSPDKLYVNGKQTFLPNTTSTYCICHTSTKHLVLEDNNRISVFLHGWLDESKHCEILERSKKVYKDFIV